MSRLPISPDLVIVAKRCVWFKTPEAALANVHEFVAHVLTYGLAKDVRTLRDHMCDDDLRASLEAAPPGVIDARSWAYWHLMLDLPPKPLPERSFA